jgi:hypothetical protein
VPNWNAKVLACHTIRSRPRVLCGSMFGHHSELGDQAVRNCNKNCQPAGTLKRQTRTCRLRTSVNGCASLIQMDAA